MFITRRSEDRGPTNAGWLNSMHTFSFGHYYDPSHMGFGPLRVINEDKVKAGAGFGTHPHNNMEIVSYVLEGALEHKDSMGNGSIIKPGDIQRMSAGSGITHSEYNHSSTEPVHFLQIWFMPDQWNIKPSYEQKSFADIDKQGQLKLVMSQDGREGSVSINQDIDMRVGLLDGDDSVVFETADNRTQWIQIAKGDVEVNGQKLSQGDGVGFKNEANLHFGNAKNAEVIMFDMGA
jgi:redox-sensitive bicupin YhaK (pirin superfamily)